MIVRIHFEGGRTRVRLNQDAAQIDACRLRPCTPLNTCSTPPQHTHAM